MTFYQLQIRRIHKFLSLPDPASGYFRRRYGCIIPDTVLVLDLDSNVLRIRNCPPEK
jgi:hypothetical protein